MPIEIDSEEKTIRASVGDLLGEESQRAIGLSGSGLTRMWIGQELHRRVQSRLVAEEDDYRPEAPTELELEVDGWTLVIHGRADGVSLEGDRVVRVDEIKTLHFAVDLYNLYADERLERFRQQLRLYAYMLSPPDGRAEARLILVDIVNHEERHQEVGWSFNSVEAWLRHRVHALISRERRRLERIEELQAAAEELRFPHEELRPGQQEIIDRVGDALTAGDHILIRAPTGCGKTAAALFPALRAALSSGQRLFFLTAKTLQQQIAVDTAKAMQEGLFRSLQLRAKGKMCANTEIICHEEHCPYAREYGLKLVRSKILANLLDSDDHQDPDRVFAAAQAHEVCPFEVSLDLMPEIDLVVCDYNYVFDPTIGLRALLHGDALRNAVLVIDEAHNLVDRAREYYSPRFGSELLEKTRAFLDSRDAECFLALRELVKRLRALVADTVSGSLDGDGPGVGPAELPEEELGEIRLALDGAMLQYFIFKRENELWLAQDPVMDLFLALTRFHRVLGLGGDEFVHLAGRERDGSQELRIFCRDASRFTGEILDSSAGAVAMSATLEPFDFYRDLLGFDLHRTRTLHVPSPFPAENRLVLAIDGVDTTYRRRAQHYDAIASWIARLSHPGRNILALFPSYAFLAAVRERLPAVSHTVLSQQPGSTDAEQQGFLEALANGKPHLVLAVLGGIFAEGVDYPGEMLSEVMVVSPALPQYGLDRELLKEYYQEFYEHGFGYAYLIPGMTRVVQAAGRLIRSDSDRGVIVLLGRRFLDRRYARLLPEEWIDDDPTTMLREDPEAAVREFFEEHDRT